MARPVTRPTKPAVKPSVHLELKTQKGVQIAQVPQATVAATPPPSSYAVICQPNITFYQTRRQEVPYLTAAKLMMYYGTKWSHLLPPRLKTNFERADVEKIYTPSCAAEIYAAVEAIWQHALPGNKNLQANARLTHIHNMVGALLMARKLDGNQVTLFRDDLEIAPRKIGRAEFNKRAEEYGVPAAMFISSMTLPVEGLGNFEGFCVKTPLK